MTRISQWEAMDEESCEPAQCGGYVLQRHIARPLLDHGLTLDFCIHSFQSVSVGNEWPGQNINEEVCSPDFVETHSWSQHSSGLFYFRRIFFFFFLHIQGSKTSVFIKDVLFFRLEKITKKERTKKKSPEETEARHVLPLGSHIELIQSVACSRQSASSSGHSVSLPPAQSVHHSLQI